LFLQVSSFNTEASQEVVEDDDEKEAGEPKGLAISDVD
jgi:hypothetical protein